MAHFIHRIHSTEVSIITNTSLSALTSAALHVCTAQSPLRERTHSEHSRDRSQSEYTRHHTATPPPAANHTDVLHEEEGQPFAQDTEETEYNPKQPKGRSNLHIAARLETYHR
jgi:hypothetical protein